jgi:hypothetical protein
MFLLVRFLLVPYCWVIRVQRLLRNAILKFSSERGRQNCKNENTPTNKILNLIQVDYNMWCGGNNIGGT